MPDIEPIESSEYDRMLLKTKGRKAPGNPFMGDGCVVNPFLNKDFNKTRHRRTVSVNSSTSTLFDDNNPFKLEKAATVQENISTQIEENISTKIKEADRPPPPVRVSSLIKEPESNSPEEMFLPESDANEAKIQNFSNLQRARHDLDKSLSTMEILSGITFRAIFTSHNEFSSIS